MKPGTKAYFRSLLKSEGLRSTDDDIICVKDGWIDAINATNKERKDQLPRAVRAYESRVCDLFSLGFLTYVYGYTDIRLTEPEIPNPEQLLLF